MQPPHFLRHGFPPLSWNESVVQTSVDWKYQSADQPQQSTCLVPYQNELVRFLHDTCELWYVHLWFKYRDKLVLEWLVPEWNLVGISVNKFRDSVRNRDEVVLEWNSILCKHHLSKHGMEYVYRTGIKLSPVSCKTLYARVVMQFRSVKTYGRHAY